MPLPVSAPFHCALMVPAQVRLERDLRALVISDPDVPVVANVDGEPKYTAAAAIDALVRQVSAPVRWGGRCPGASPRPVSTPTWRLGQERS